MNDKRKYLVTANSIVTQVYPIDDKQTIYSHEQEDDQIFYIKKLKDGLTFVNQAGIFNSFSYFYNFENNPAQRCTNFTIDIFVLCNGSWVLEWEGKFGLTDAEWDLDTCSVKIKPTPDTKYNCIAENKNVEVNMLDVATIIATKADLDFNYEYFVCREDTSALCALPGTQTNTWKIFWQSLNRPYSTNCTPDLIWIRVYYREFVVTACIGSTPNPPPGAGWLLETNNCGFNSTAKYVRDPQLGAFPNVTVGPGWYNPVTAQDEVGPEPQRKQIIVSTTPASEEIRLGPLAIVSSTLFGGTSISYRFEVFPNPNSTYVWSLDGSSPVAATVVGTSYFCTVTPTNATSGNIIIKLTETHGNGYVSTKTYTIPQTSVSSGFDTANIQMNMLGPRYACKNQGGLQYLIISNPTTSGAGMVSQIIWTVSGATINSGQGTTSVNITSGTTNFTVQAEWNINYNNWPNGGTGDFIIICKAITNVTVSNYPVTTEPEMITHLYPTEPTTLLVQNKPTNNTYTWFQDNTSLGNGVNFFQLNLKSYVAPSAGTYCIAVKEYINCGCSWVLITASAVHGVLGRVPPIYWCPDLSSGVSYTRNRIFKEVVEYLVSEIGCGITAVVSDFLGWNPVGDAPGYSPGINYVTGTTNKLINLTIGQKSDVINPTSSNAATKGLITFENLEDIWRIMFNAYWFIDSSNRLRIEHISYFQRTVAFDTTISPHSVYNAAKRKYTYDKSRLPKYEKFSFSEMLYTDFIGTAIYYDNLCVDQDSKTNTKENALGFITSDLYVIKLDPANINKVGFVLFCNDLVNGVYTVNVELGLLSNSNVANGHLSWANLHYAYHRHNRILIQGYMNNVLTTFLSAKQLREQKEIVIKKCCGDNFDPLLQLYKTGLGNGILKDAEESSDGIIKMNLML